jgi:hypothetical protein
MGGVMGRGSRKRTSLASARGRFGSLIGGPKAGASKVAECGILPFRNAERYP